MNMKKYLWLIIGLLVCSSLFGANQTTKTIVESAEVEIQYGEIRIGGDFTTKDKILNFIEKIVFEKDEIRKKKPKIYKWKYKENLDDSAIIFLRHTIDEEKFYDSIKKSDNKKNKDKKNKNDKEAKLLQLQERQDKLKKKLETFEKQFESLAEALKKSKESKSTSGNKKSSEIDVRESKIDLLLLSQEIRTLKQEIKELDIIIDKKNRELEEERIQYIEKEQIVSVVLHHEAGEWSPYLLETKKIMIVLLGGANDLGLADVEIENRAGTLKKSLSDIKSVYEKLKPAAPEAVPCRVILLNPKKIKPPSIIRLKHSSFKQDLEYEIHEKAFLEFKIGIAYSNLEKSDFKIEDKKLVISLDDERKKVWKESLNIFLDFYPFGRDIDRFGSIFKRGNTPLLKRFGIFAGVKLSKDPLESLFGGISFSISRMLTLNAGITINKQEEEQVIEIGDITSLEDVKNLANRKYTNPQLFIGLSFPPSAISKAFGFDKKK